MKDINRNVGRRDRASRAFVALVIGMLYITYVVHGILGNLLYVLGMYMLITSIIAFDPYYYWRDKTTKDKYDDL